MATPYAGKVYKLNNKCGFVETGDGTAKLIDKSKPGQPEFYDLSETQAFILRNLILRVDTEFIKQMYISEFTDQGNKVDEGAAEKAIQDVIYLFGGFLQVITAPGIKTHTPPQMPPAQAFNGLSLDFSVEKNSWGIWIIKLPLV